MRPLPLLAAVLLAACSEAPSGPPAGLSLSTTVTPAVVRAGERLDVRLVVANQGDAPRVITINRCPQLFVITDVRGDTVSGPGGSVCSAVLMQTTLAPDAEYVFDLSSSAPAVPGAYTLRAEVGAVGGLLVGDAVSITVTP